MKKLILTLVFLSLNSHAELFDDKLLIRFAEDATMSEVGSIVEQAGLVTTKVISELQLYVAKPEDKFTIEKLNELKSNPRVLYVEPNHKITLDAKPNDPRLWGDGLHLRAAWDISTGSRNIIVAVSDTGVLWKHEDLTNQIWTNSREVAGNGVDDDGNGFVDDIHGWNFFSNTNNSNDDHNHGSHVAGIIGAEGNNAKGLAGVNWSVTIMPLKFLDKGGSGSTEGGIETVLYAVNNGARVINASWGGGDFNQAMYDSLAYANSKGVLFVAAAGNDGTSNDRYPHYPSSYQLPNVISVASATSTAASSMQSWSNFGRRSVHIAAPGLKIMSCSKSSAKSYMSMSGTSMATPAIAGIAALVLSVHPQLGVVDLRNAILNGVRGKVHPVSTRGFADTAMTLNQFNRGPQIWPVQMSFAKGSKFQYTAYGFSGPIQWSVDNPSIATISDTGVLTAVAPGKVVVTVTGGGNQTASTVLAEVMK